MDPNGIYEKYVVERTDGKPEDCQYFVLNLDKDPYALAAIEAYAQACRSDNPGLSSDLLEMASMRKGGNYKQGELNAYYVVSSQVSPCFFDRKHELVTSLDKIRFDYCPIKNPEGVYGQTALLADNDFLAGIEFVRMSIDMEAIRDLMFLSIAASFGEVSPELFNLIERLNRLLPSEEQLIRGQHYEAER